MVLTNINWKDRCFVKDEEIESLEEKLGIAVEALEKIKNLNDDSRAMGCAYSALEKIKAK